MMTIAAKTAITIAVYQSGVVCMSGGSTGRTALSTPPLTADSASAMVKKLSHEKLPLRTSQHWVTTMTRAPVVAIGSGANNNHGTTSCATWLAATSTRCIGFGRWWKYQLSGFGIGWVSW